ncbi:MAG: metal-dependent hydrolase [Acidimicrobiales bacterium]|nr:metal-dependent hydrolase [Acidimicrobiales bacterium]
MATTTKETSPTPTAPAAPAGVDKGADKAVRDVPTRRISFEESLRSVPKHFAADGDLIASHLIATLSSLFPDGEDFFVRSVRHYRSQISDPELKRQVTGFIGQESVHGREHRAFNDRLAELGYPTKRYEQLVRWALTAREKVGPPQVNLAVTAALEHFTATLAELVLSDEDFRNRMGHPAVRDLFLWHALEEAEHKAVAFDVYRAIGGSERVRIWTMKVIRKAFAVVTVLMVIGSLLRDRATYRPGTLRASWRRFKQTPFLQRQLWDQLRSYDRRGFHPDDRDTTELVAQWREALFGAEGTLNDKLTSVAAAAA